MPRIQAERHDHRLELHPQFAELVHPRRGRWRELASLDDRSALELVEPLSQDIRADARQSGAQVGESLRTEESSRTTRSAPADAERTFQALEKGAKNIAMPLQKTFWAEQFAMVVDRFGTPWMINGGMVPM